MKTLNLLIFSFFIVCTSLVSAQSGILDTTFGNSGTATTICSQSDRLLVQRDGKLIDICNLGITRLHPNGSIDSSFGVNGVSTVDSSFGFGYKNNAVLQSDGKIVVVKANQDLSVFRIDSNGVLDSSFGVNGKFHFSDTLNYTNFGGGRIIQDQSGKLVIATTGFIGSTSTCWGLGVMPAYSDIILFRLDAKGELDSSFNGDGIMDSIFGHNWGYAIGNDIIQQDDGKYIVVGSVPDACLADKELAMARITNVGKLDSSFANQGKFQKAGSNGQYANVLLKKDQKIYAIGWDTLHNIMDRYTTDGSPDITFGVNGSKQYSIFNLFEFSGASFLPDSTIMISTYMNVSFLKMDGDYADSCRYHQVDILGPNSVLGYGSEVAFHASDLFYRININVGIQKLLLRKYILGDSLQSSTCAKYIFNGKEYRNSGQYQDTLQTTQGCDSVIFLDLSITPVDNSVTQNGATFTAPTTSTSYQWINCASMQPIAGENNQNFTPTANGSFAVIVTENGCTDTSACYTINNVGLEEWDQKGISVFPNPNSGSLTLQFSQEPFSGQLEIHSLNGQLVHQQKLEHKEQAELKLNLDKGVYLLRLSSQNQHFIQPLIIQ